MKRWSWILLALVAATIRATAHAEDPAQEEHPAAQEKSAGAEEKSPVAQEKDACKQEEQQKGTSAPASSVKCAVKVMFQSRIRRRKDDEPVEMTAGSPPLQTEDTETPGDRNLEINMGVLGESGGGEHRHELPVLDINYGVGDTLQFSYSIPYVFARQAVTHAAGEEEMTSAHGVGDSSVQLKYRFYDNTDTGLSFAIAPLVQFRTPGANREVSEGRTVTVLPLIATREYANASITANAGVELSAGEQRYFGSFAVGRRISDTVAVLAEVAGNNLNAADDKRVLLDFGVRRKISGSQSISAALGRDIQAGGGQAKQVYFTFMYQRMFGE